MKNISNRTMQASVFTVTLLALFAQGQFAAAKPLSTWHEVAAAKLSSPVSETQRHLDESLLIFP